MAVYACAATAASSLMVCCVFAYGRRKPRSLLKNNMFLVLPDVYRPHTADEKMRLVIEYNMRVGPVAAHFDNGDKWDFLSAPHACAMQTRWTLFLDDYLGFGINNVTAVATHVGTDTMRLTMSSENVVLSCTCTTL